ncbi:tripartite tricarboxylate transporter substrate binding protein [Bordetella sp. 15P40C-2]|uniref:tripartite tricarboxylate transporter substrate binding protein n=1 Tax=Bordetella sp. 15P40C-2 TaxID=2572246 RepID=UPI0013667EBA
MNLTVMYGVGGNTDLVARSVAAKLEKIWGKTVVVHNRAGGQGTVAMDWLRRQAPDGYQLGMVTGSSIALAPHLNKAEYRPDDFTFLGSFGSVRLGVAVHASSGIDSMQALIDEAKKREVFLGSGAVLNSLLLLDMNKKFGTKFVNVPYKSGSEVQTALMGKHVDVIVGNPTDILQHLGSGMRLLSVAGVRPWPETPDVPTLTQLKLSTVDVVSWLGLAGPKGLPQEVRQKVESALVELAADPEFQKRMDALGTDAFQASGADTAAYMASRHSQWRNGLVAAGLLEDTPVAQAAVPK